MNHTTDNPWEIQHSQVVYDNAWIQLINHDVMLKSNEKKGIYGVVHFKNIAIGILALDQDQNTYLIGQYRFPLKSYSWKIPEGGCPSGELPLEAAKRELLEEAGIRANSWTPILEMHLSNSVSDEQCVIFLAKDLQFGKNQPEETEVLQLKKVPFEEVYQNVLKGEITDSISVAAILRVKLMLLQKQV